MTFFALPLAALLVLTGCDEGCSRPGYEAMRVRLVSAAPAPPQFADGGCTVYTDVPTDTRAPDQYGDALRHIGRSVYECLTGAAAPGGDGVAFYDDLLWIRIDGQCPNNYFGCFEYKCRTIDTVLTHIGPPSLCPAGATMDQWGEACWSQFYAVLGHEVMHGWLGAFHA